MACSCTFSKVNAMLTTSVIFILAVYKAGTSYEKMCPNLSKTTLNIIYSTLSSLPHHETLLC